MDFQAFLERMLDPSHILTHVPYALLVLSMLMNDMGWLRAISIGAGVIRIVNRAWFEVENAETGALSRYRITPDAITTTEANASLTGPAGALATSGGSRVPPLVCRSSR